jgi:phosphate transport system protein
MIENPETVARCLNLMVVAKSLERIADHAKNVAEEVVYLCEAEDIRHSGKSKAEFLEDSTDQVP